MVMMMTLNHQALAALLKNRPDLAAELGDAAAPRKSKYNNRLTERDGYTFHSQKEADRWSEL